VLAADEMHAKDILGPWLSTRKCGDAFQETERRGGGNRTGRWFSHGQNKHRGQKACLLRSI